jgi:hypothetical protein
MTTMNSIDDMMQLLRTLKTSQARKQLEHDSRAKPPRYWDSDIEEWVPRSAIIHGFLYDAKEQS